MPHDEEDLENQEGPTEREIGRDAATPGGRQNRRPSRRTVSSMNARAGVGFFDDGEMLPQEAELAWPEIITRLESKGLTAYDVRVEVVQIDPPAPSGKAYLLGSFNAGSIQGSTEEAPGAALVRYITDYFHLPRPASQGSVTYQLRFSTKNQAIARAQLTLGSRQEILALRNADRTRRAQEGEVPAPLPYQPPPAYTPAPTAAGVAGAPPMMPPNAGMGVSEVFNLAREMATMMASGQQVHPQMLDMVMRLATAQQHQQTGVAAPPAVSEDAIAERVTTTVIMTLAKLGVIPTPGQQPTQVQPTQAAAGVAAPVPAKSRIEQLFERVMDTAAQTFASSVEKTMTTSIRQATGMAGAPAEVAAAEETEKPEEPQIPWKPMPVPGATWGNGSAITYAEDAETGGFSPMGFVMSNPILMEKGLEAATGLAGAATKALQKLTEPKSQQPRPTMIAGQPPPMMAPPPPPQVVENSAEDWK